ncbi:MAG: hypothetical protein ACYS1A_04340 [Planctomycetota bacterium]|jgi:hypothetical protein
MAEQKQQTEKKKRGLFRQIALIFKWIGLILLGILLIAALIFQAPWKVTTLLAIVFLACTILPRPYRKWFWASVGAVVIVLVVWVFLPDDNEGWRPYTFDEELAALEAERAIPEEQNAAKIYKQLLQDYEQSDFEPNLTDPNVFYLTISESWSGADYPQMAQWLENHQSKIAKLIQACEKDECRFPINASPTTSGQRMDRTNAMMLFSYLLTCAANKDLGEGKIDEGLKKYITTLQMAQHLYQQPATTDLMIGIGTENLASVQLNRFVIEGQPTVKQLQLISGSFKDLKNNFSSKLAGILEYNKLYTKMFYCMYYEINTKGKVRLNRDPGAAFRAQSPQEIPPSTYWQRKLVKTGILLAWFLIPTPQKFAEMVDNAYIGLGYYAMAKPGFDWEKEPVESRPRFKLNYRYVVELIAGLNKPAYHRFYDIYLKGLTYRRGSRLLVAMRRYQLEHGSWPQSLDQIKSSVPPEALIDPATGQELQYENHGEHFSLYGETTNIWPK